MLNTFCRTHNSMEYFFSRLLTRHDRKWAHTFIFVVYVEKHWFWAVPSNHGGGAYWGDAKDLWEVSKTFLFKRYNISINHTDWPITQSVLQFLLASCAPVTQNKGQEVKVMCKQGQVKRSSWETGWPLSQFNLELIILLLLCMSGKGDSAGFIVERTSREN